MRHLGTLKTGLYTRFGELEDQGCTQFGNLNKATPSCPFTRVVWPFVCLAAHGSDCSQYISEHCFFLWFRCLYTGTMPTQLLRHAYAEWEGCLRGSFPRLGAYAGASAGFFVGWPCSRKTNISPHSLQLVAVLNATLDLAALVLVGVAAFLGSEVVLAPFGSLHVRCERKNERMTIYCCGKAFGQRASK